MALYKFATAASAIAAGATNQNVLAGDKISVAGYPRTLQGFCCIETDNTPVMDELTWRIYAGPILIGQGGSILAQTTGAQVRVPDDFTPIQTIIPAGQTITVEIVNGDGAAAHGAQLHFMFDRL